jgi:hypothetical protein
MPTSNSELITGTISDDPKKNLQSTTANQVTSNKGIMGNIMSYLGGRHKNKGKKTIKKTKTIKRKSTKKRKNIRKSRIGKKSRKRM